MGIDEIGNDRQSLYEEDIIEELKEKQLWHDAFTEWVEIEQRMMLFREGTFSVEEAFLGIVPIKKYEEKLRSDRKYTSGDVRLVMELSDSSAVAAFDQLVDECNADLERMKREQDVEAMGQFTQRAVALRKLRKNLFQ